MATRSREVPPRRAILMMAVAVGLASCAGFEPRPLHEVPFRAREQTQTVDGVTVAAAVPTAAEAEQIYGVSLASERIQPVWLEVRNESDQFLWFLPAGLDSHHYSPAEAAFAFHRSMEGGGPIESHFEALAFENPIPPRATASGFVLVNLDEGYKPVNIDLVGRESSRSYTFVFVDPDFRSDVSTVDLDALWPPDERVDVETEDELRAALAALPKCTTNASGEDEGDPLNLVMIGDRLEIFAAMVRRGWQATEIITPATIWRTIKSFLSGSRYRYSPISALYVYGRPQDFSAQKVRGSIHERNHMRFWLTPVVFRGKEVWLGQISRDIGVKFTLKSPTISTHLIDPDLDEARRYLLDDLAYSQSLERVGFCEGVGRTPPEEPRRNLVGDPYYTDGHRAVLFFGPRPLSLADVEVLDWEVPGLRRRERIFE